MGNGVRDGEKGGCGFALPTLQKTRPFKRRVGKRERSRRHVSLSVLSGKGPGKGSL